MVPHARTDAPLAEYWIGAHPKGPAQIELQDGTLIPFDVALKRAPQTLLGKRSIERFGEQLPFMVKVLSINREHGLSIQLHPTREEARALRASSPEHYPDENHKPEVGIALTEVSLLYGCKSPRDIQQTLLELPGLKAYIGTELATRIESFAGVSKNGTSLVKEAFSTCLTLDEARTRECVEYLRATLPRAASFAREALVFNRLEARYGAGDAGLIALVLMNYIVLRPGEAIFIAANVPHSYLDGDLFECMACSDNVVRAGLTPKFKDARALTRLVDCDPHAEGVLSLTADSGGFSSVETPTEEFRVRVMERGSGRATIRGEDGPGVVLCVGERLSVRGVSTGRQLEVIDGGAVFLPADSGEYELVTTNAALFYVTPSLI